jgi:hypothetical protein
VLAADVGGMFSRYWTLVRGDSSIERKLVVPIISPNLLQISVLTLAAALPLFRSP